MGLGQDLRQAWRALAAAPAVAVAAILSLALGIGANTAIFSVASPLLLRPLPYADPDRLVILWNRSPGLGITEDWFSTAQYFDIRGTGTFADVALAIGGNENLTGGGEPERIGTIRVSSNLLPMLGVRPALGRLFTADEDRAGAAGTALLAHGTWLRRYGGDAAAVGRIADRQRRRATASSACCPPPSRCRARCCRRSAAPNRPSCCCRCRSAPTPRRSAPARTTTSSPASRPASASPRRRRAWTR